MKATESQRSRLESLRAEREALVRSRAEEEAELKRLGLPGHFHAGAAPPTRRELERGRSRGYAYGLRGEDCVGAGAAAWAGNLRADGAGARGPDPGPRRADHPVAGGDDPFERARIKLRVMAFDMGGEDFEKAFRRMDRDGDGTLSYEELRHVLSKKAALSEHELHIVFRLFDAKGDGKIDLEEFLSTMRRELSESPWTQDELARADPEAGARSARAQRADAAARARRDRVAAGLAGRRKGTSARRGTYFGLYASHREAEEKKKAAEEKTSRNSGLPADASGRRARRDGGSVRRDGAPAPGDTSRRRGTYFGLYSKDEAKAIEARVAHMEGRIRKARAADASMLSRGSEDRGGASRDPGWVNPSRDPGSLGGSGEATRDGGTLELPSPTRRAADLMDLPLGEESPSPPGAPGSAPPSSTRREPVPAMTVSRRNTTGFASAPDRSPPPTHEPASPHRAGAAVPVPGMVPGRRNTLKASGGGRSPHAAPGANSQIPPNSQIPTAGARPGPLGLCDDASDPTSSEDERYGAPVSPEAGVDPTGVDLTVRDVARRYAEESAGASDFRGVLHGRLPARGGEASRSGAVRATAAWTVDRGMRARYDAPTGAGPFRRRSPGHAGFKKALG
jgi:hypothetical protein